ncbi:MAG: hypothetical protein M3165_01830, partial [Actinomycetota bacterium]|nr:hypothetical protein [Actinomycetota bacterium]
AACTVVGGDSAPAPTPRPAATPQQRELALGDPAAVTIRVSGERARVRLAVTRVEERTTKDLAQFRLNARTRRSTPYFATVRVTKLGGGDLSGRQVTLWALGSDGTVRPPAEVLGIFRPCRSRPLPSRFAEGDSARTCLLYLMPRGTTLQAVQYRFGDRPPYSWTVG